MTIIGRMPNRLKVRAILRQLEDERIILLGGRYQGLQAVTERLTKLTEELDLIENSDDSELGAQLAKVRRAAVRNMRLTKASLKGLEAARQKIHQIETMQSRLSTYTGDGARQDIAASNSTQEKRS